LSDISILLANRLGSNQTKLEKSLEIVNTNVKTNIQGIIFF